MRGDGWWGGPTSSHTFSLFHVNWHMVHIIYAYSSLPINTLNWVSILLLQEPWFYFQQQFVAKIFQFSVKHFHIAAKLFKIAVELFQSQLLWIDGVLFEVHHKDTNSKSKEIVKWFTKRFVAIPTLLFSVSQLYRWSILNHTENKTVTLNQTTIWHINSNWPFIKTHLSVIYVTND